MQTQDQLFMHFLKSMYHAERAILAWTPSGAWR